MKLSFFFFFSFLGVGSTLDVASVCQKCLDNEDCRRAYNMISEKACAPQNIQTFQAAFSMGAERASVDADVRDAVAYAGLFLEHLAAFDRPAPDSCGSFVALACGHNAPWRRKERDALYAWLEVQLPPSS